jgi:hypothetical protein
MIFIIFLRRYDIQKTDTVLVASIKLGLCESEDSSPVFKKSLKIPKGQSESVYRRRTDNTMVKRTSTKGQTTIYKTYT